MIDDSTTVIGICSKCGKPKDHGYSDFSGTYMPCTCYAEPTKEQGDALQGWTCPVCGRGISPFVNSCNHGKVDYVIT